MDKDKLKLLIATLVLREREHASNTLIAAMNRSALNLAEKENSALAVHEARQALDHFIDGD